MTKHVVLSVLCKNGKREAVSSDISEPILTMARKARDTGFLGRIAIVSGVVMSTERGVIMRFRHDPKPAAAAADAEVDEASKKVG